MENSEFKIVCDGCGSLTIKPIDSAHAASETKIQCGRCNAVRGTGNMSLHAGVLVGCIVAHIVLTPLLIFGWGPIPALGPAGAGWGLVIPFAVGSLIMMRYLRSPSSIVQLNFRGKDGLLAELAQTPWNPDEQSVGRARSSRCDNGPYDMHVFMVAGANSGHPGLPLISLYGAAMRAKSEGRWECVQRAVAWVFTEDCGERWIFFDQ